MIAADITAADITAVVLCGGEGQRMGGADKPLLPFGGRPLVQHVLDGLDGSVSQVLLVANRSLDAYRQLAHDRLPFGPCEVICDAEPGLGPLAGIAAAAHHLPTPWAFVCAGDVPFVSAALVQRLVGHRTGYTDAARVAHDGERRQPLFALIPRAVMLTAADALKHSESRSVAGWLAAHGAECVPAADLANQMISIDEPSQLRQLG
ncbi:molybdenum cofactor guanylyltransferase [Gemmatimonas sp. UBA7669]|uniref:molybdenum cofactor guanylyltransferase n=1 Tax=Gemmatimonas sp. UBA7669 TaxID=1946568 RepID=UPI0025B8CD12|nr:molybdenum cofactor guanylyltransferase [Gemmatimonas sp. UBA7669]